MARAIDKQTMLDLIIEAKRMGPETCSFSEWLAEYLVDHLPTITPPNEWVSVEERLPGAYKQVLMWSAKWRIIEAGSYYNGHFWVHNELGDGYIAENITYWMILPAPPNRRPPKGEMKDASN